MKKIICLIFIAAAMVFVGCQKPETSASAATLTKENLENKAVKFGYAMGLDAGGKFKSQNFPIDANAFSEAFKLAFNGAKEQALMNEEEISAALMELQTEMMTKLKEEMAKKAVENKAKGDKFLAENRTKEGVKVTDSGLQYLVLKAGEGEHPGAEDTVEVHYTGTLLDGTEFDSSYKRNEPLKFQLNRVIKGWGEGLQLMNKGAKYKLFIPPELAYGERGAGMGGIGPNETLIFEVELLSFNKKAPDKAGAEQPKPEQKAKTEQPKPEQKTPAEQPKPKQESPAAK